MAPATALFNDRLKDSRARLVAPVVLTSWSSGQLAMFTFLMSGHGLPVCASVMVGSTDYARQQLRLACTFDDQVLQQLAVGMLRHFTPTNPTPQDAHQWSH